MLSRGKLEESDYTDINNKVPNLDRQYSSVLALSPSLIPIVFPPNSRVPIAAVCLRDATNVLADANFALRESFAHQLWYQKNPNEAREWVGVYYSKFFADDVALRLYSAGEHLAKAIECMLEIDKADLEKYRKKNRISQQVLIGKFLHHEHPHHKITQAIKQLVQSKDWRKTLNYRNDWVHQQPPSLEGLGIVYKRQNRWQVTDAAIQLSFGGGDKPDYSISDLLGFIQPAINIFAITLEEVTDFYVELLKAKGINIAPGKGTEVSI
jgi:hypothetical protein